MAVISPHGGNIYSYNKITDFSANINPLGISPKVEQALSNYKDALLNYPDPDCGKLKMKLAQKHNISTDNILIGNGSIELIYLIPQYIKPACSLIISPAFSEFETACIINNSRIKRITLTAEHSFKPDIETVIAQLDNVSLVSIINPNNPTGFLISPNDMQRLLSACEKYGVYLVIDEAFLDFTEPADKYSLIQYAAQSKYLIVLRSLTKFYALAGLRLGYMAANNKIINGINRLKPPWSVNQLAQNAGLAAICDTDYYHKTRGLIKKEREFLYNELCADRRFLPYQPTANYILVKLVPLTLPSPQGGEGFTSDKLQSRLINKGYLIRDCANFTGLDNSFFRLAVRTRKENQGLIEVLLSC